MEAFSQDSTQPATQQLTAHNGIAPSSENNGEDYKGIICFLHPCSQAAIAIVQHTKKTNPGLVVRLPVPQMSNNPDQANDSDPDSTQVDSATGEVTAIDIALRARPGPRNPHEGFLFGRNPLKCDVLMLEKQTSRRISNIHFRIYCNTNGALMLEDQSTNGTWVNDTKLCKGGADGQKRVLSPGSIIFLCPGNIDDLIRFIVRIPKANGNGFATNSLEAAPLVGIDPGHPGPPPRFSPPQLAGPGVMIHSPQRNIAAMRRNPFNQSPVQEYGRRLGQNRFGPPLHKPFDAHTVMQPSGMTAWPGDRVYSLEDQIGRGAFATVSKAYERRTGNVVAVKTIAKRNFATQIGTDRLGVKKEVDILERLNHPNIVNYINYYEDTTHVYVVMEYIEHGDLNNYLNENVTMPEPLAKEVVHQVLRGIEYIHAMGISHRDLKPDNILIAEREPIKVKISDFGLAKIVQNEDTFLKTFCGTMLYLAPEVFPGYMTALMNDGYESAAKRKRLPVDEGQGRSKDSKPQPRRRYNQAVDMWSLGCVVYALLCGSPPFEGKNQDDMCKMVTRGVFDESRLHRHVGRDNRQCVDFIRKLLRVQPELRIMEQEALRHPWVAGLGSSMDFDEDEIPGIRYDSEGFAIRDSPVQIEMDNYHENGGGLHVEKCLQTPDVDESHGEPELRGSLAEMNMSQESVHQCPKQRDLNFSSMGDVFEPVFNSATQGLSIINRHRDSVHRSSGVLSVAYDMSLFSPERFSGYRKEEVQHPGLASSGALGTQNLLENVTERDAKNNAYFDSTLENNPDSLNSAEAGLNKLQSAPPSSTPALQRLKIDDEIVPSFSFNNAAPNFSPDSLKDQSPQDLDQPKSNKNIVANSNIGDENLPSTQPVPSQGESKFIVPALPWGKLISLPGSKEISVIQLVDQQVQIGRSENSTWRSQDVRISKHHVAFQINHPEASYQIDHRESRIGEWRPDAGMVVTFQVNGQSGIFINGQKFRQGESGMLCNGDRIELFRDPSNNEFIGFTAELSIGLVQPEDRKRFSGLRKPNGTILGSIDYNVMNISENDPRPEDRHLSPPDMLLATTRILRDFARSI